MTKYILLIAATITGISPAEARLDETFQQCIARYGDCLRDTNGKPKVSGKLLPNSAQAEWIYDGFSIKMAWMAPEGPNGPADMMIVANTKGSLTEAQTQAILNANSLGMTWQVGLKREVQRQQNQMQKTNAVGGAIQAFGMAVVGKAFSAYTTSYYRADGAEANPNLNLNITFKSKRLIEKEETKKDAEQKDRENIPKL